MPFATIPASYTGAGAYSIARRLIIKSSTWRTICQDAQFTYATRVKTLAHDMHFRGRSINAAAWTQVLGGFQLTTGSGVVRLLYYTRGYRGLIRITLTAGAVIIGPIVNTHAGAVGSVETIIPVNPETTYDCVVEVMNNGGPLSIYTLSVREDDLARADLSI